MKRVRKSILLWYSPLEMYDLVTDIERYPTFLPWCERAQILEADGEGITAQLTLVKGGVRHAFTTRNRHRHGEQVDVSLVNGPFSLLEGHWRFLPVGRGGAVADAKAQACRIEFDMRYAFSNAALEALVSPVFDRIANTLVDSFVQRAEQVHGVR